ncbi:TP53-regulated inhibitor of apoptosis 1 [Geodia barretti]|uniref:TP53-regulated inhibitor of apoptosis 1 n=1 Tax=Geodia barretti TaxID=519541 RepID=A0AA35S4E9_GEOBA|nr:TP53-regulated inhibitor of apoptosis 1 [Geodia barretti]
MESLDERCTPLKVKYDECFNAWFRSSFLKGRGNHEDACGRLFTDYQACLKAALEREGLNSPALSEHVLGTDKEKKTDSK